MEILKKLLILGMIPAFSLATGNEAEEGPFLRRQLNYKNLILKSVALGKNKAYSDFTDSQYCKELVEGLNELKVQDNHYKLSNVLDVTKLEEAILKKTQISHEGEIESLQKQVSSLRAGIEDLQNRDYRTSKAKAHFMTRTYPRAMRRSFGFGGFTGLFTSFLVASAYSNFSKIRSYFSRTK